MRFHSSLNRQYTVAATIPILIVILLSFLLANGFFVPSTMARPFYVGVEYAYADDTENLKALAHKIKELYQPLYDRFFVNIF